MLSQEVIRDLENKLCLNYPGRFIIAHGLHTCAVCVPPHYLQYSTVYIKIFNILDMGLVSHKEYVNLYIVCKTKYNIVLLHYVSGNYDIQDFLYNIFHKNEPQDYMYEIIV